MVNSRLEKEVWRCKERKKEERGEGGRKAERKENIADTF